MNRRHQPPLQLSSINYDDETQDNHVLFPNQEQCGRMRCRSVARAKPDESTTPIHLRRSPFATPTFGAPSSRALDNQSGGNMVGVRARHVSSRPAPSPKVSQSPRLVDLAENFEDIRAKLIEAKLLADKANSLLYERRSNVRYRVSLQVPISCLNQAKRGQKQLHCEPVIELHRGSVKERSMSLARMQSCLKKLESNRGDFEDSGISTSYASNGGYEAKRALSKQSGLQFANGDHVLVGVANIYLRCLLFVREFAYQVPILNPHGEVYGRLLVELSTALRTEKPRSNQLPGALASTGRFELAYLDADVFEVRVTIREAIGIPRTFSKMILCHYKMIGMEEPIVVLPKLESFSLQNAPTDPTNPEYENNQRCRFDHEDLFRLPLTHETLRSLTDYALSVEVYGNLQEPKAGTSVRRMTSSRGQVYANCSVKVSDQQQANSQVLQHRAGSPHFTRSTKLRRYKSDLADRQKPVFQNSPTVGMPEWSKNALSNEVAARLAEEWLKVQRRIDFWVAIEELAEDGTFKKVSVVPSSDVKTGGVYHLRQGLNRRIRVLIRPNEPSRKEKGIMPLVCETVSQVSVGCVTRSLVDFDGGSSSSGKSQPSPDSYQEYDLELVRHKWCNAMDEWQSYLQHNLQVLAKKQEKDAADEAKEGYLLNRWVSLIQERDAILVPAPGSCLPGAPATEIPPLGLEQHTPLVFADIGTGTLGRNLKAGANSYLDGEEAALRDGKVFVDLPLIKTYATLVGALASWDSNLHESDLLNKITPSTERIYLIVKVNIQVVKPIRMTLVLRKRICVKICRRSPLATIFKSPFSRMVSNEKEDLLWTGVTYQFVAGIPQMTPYTPSLVATEAEKADLSIESLTGQYMRTIQSVSSELYLDELRQEVALRETLAKNQHLRQPFNLDGLGLELQDSGLLENGLTRSRSFNERSKRLTSDNVMRQHSQSRLGLGLYPELPRSPSDERKTPTSDWQNSNDQLGRERANGADVECLGEELSNYTISVPKNSSPSEDLMAWSRRDREKHKRSS